MIICKDELNKNKKNTTLASAICGKYKIEYSEAICAVDSAISEAFNSKYGTYKYSDDTHSLDSDWKEKFLSLYEKLCAKPMSMFNIINVGVGSGNEAIALFSDCRNITFVDIARGGLQKIQKEFPHSKVITSSAENLSCISDNSYELYISLRTYNSSFFDIHKAISEAHRVIKPNSLIMISIANGFLCPEKNYIIPGLIIPGTEFVDIYRGMDTVKLVHREFMERGFQNVLIYPTNTEIYISAITN